MDRRTSTASARAGCSARPARSSAATRASRSSTATSSSSSPAHDADAAIPGLRAHLDGCPACREEHESLRALVALERRAA